MKKIIVAIDGYSGTGKSSTAKEVAKRLGYIFIDTGAMYRAVTYYFLKNGVDPSISTEVSHGLSQIDLKFDPNNHSVIYLNDQPLSNEIRTMEVNQHVSTVAAVTAIRRDMVSRQQEMGKAKGLVMDGRDIGTMVFPEAELKIFMTASLETRGKRRQLELKEKGIDSSLDEVIANMQERDQIDSSREEGPLRKADGALEIDTSDLTFEEQVSIIMKAANKIIHEG